MSNTKKRKLKFIQLHNLRLGLATNSSSSHSMISGTTMISNGYELINESNEIGEHLITTKPEIKWAIIALYAYSNIMSAYNKIVRHYSSKEKLNFNMMVEETDRLVAAFKTKSIDQAIEFLPESSPAQLLELLEEVAAYMEYDIVYEAIKQGFLNQGPKMPDPNNASIKEQYVARESEQWLRWIKSAQQIIESPSIVMYWHDEYESAGPMVEQFSHSVL